ncbi:MAG TPA: peptide ABC transporter substrate-binding protein [Candidatus Baltobacteraceae bacterium]|nr:peptide ABC transporter substrate-binding protein [Candidatus Baltobacteraceae bacterium]
MRRLLFGLAVALLTACTSASGTHQSGAPLTIGEPQEPQSLNTLLLQGEMTILVGPTVYSSLLTADARGNLVPDLARQVPSLANGGISRDGLTITYHLRKGVKWQDGTPLTAADVVFTSGAVMNPRNDVQSRTGFDVVAGVRAVDAQTVRVRLKHAYSPILSYFFGPDQNYQVLPRHLLARYSDLNHVAFNVSPVGSGPYRVASWQRGDNIVLRSNALYFRGKPGVAEIRLRFIPDSNTLLQELRTGEVNVVFNADPAYLQQYRSLRNMTVTLTPVNATQGLLFNTADPLMHDVRVRRAIIEALDIPRLVRDATRGAQTAQAAGGGFFSWAYDPSITPPGYNPTDANRLLDAAGWKRGPGGLRQRNGAMLSVEFALVSGLADAEQSALMVQQQLRPFGIAVTLRKYSPVQYAAPAQNGGPLFGGNFQMAFLQILSGIDPSTEYFFGCDQVPPRGFNLSRYCDPQIQRALDADEQTYDPATRRRYSEIVQRVMAQELPWVPLWRRRSISVYPAWLHGVNPSPTTPYWNVWEWRT